MYKATIFTLFLILLGAGSAFGQGTEYILDVSTSTVFEDPFTTGLQSGVRAVAGPFDMDGDGNMEVLVTDYTGGGRVHVIENRGPDTWEWVYSTPWIDSTATTSFNARYVWGTNASADLDGDGRGEILLPTGRRFGVTSPYTEQGIFVFEYTGTDDDYGMAPASILPVEDRIYVQGSMLVEDIDGDGIQELLFPNNGSGNEWDQWYVYSVSGDIGSGFEVWVAELAQPSRPDHGGGSPYGFLTPDFDGNGSKELLLHSWNSYNFTIGQATAADTYDVPGGQNRQAENAANNGLGTSYDAVAFAGGTVIDINQDGDDEVFLNNALGGGPHDFSLTLINYEEGEDVAQITSDNIVLDLLPDESFIWGMTSGDLDGDGNNEVIAVGWGYSGADRGAGIPSQFVKIAEFTGGPGGDPEDPNNYFVERINTGDLADEAGFDLVERDSLGTMSSYYDNNGLFAFRAAYLGDADNDGENEVVLGFQGQRDSVSVIDEVWNADSTRYERTTRSTTVASSRPFMRILSGDGLAVKVEDTRIVVPSDYVLSPNYPNPFNPSTSFTFTLPIDKRVSVRIYDMTGRLVRTLVNGEFYAAGTHQATWDGTSDAGVQVASGTYLYTLEHGNFRQSRTMLLIK